MTKDLSQTDVEVRVTDQPVHTEQVDALRVEAYADRAHMGAAAARYSVSVLQDAIDERGRARVVFASAPSQVEFLQALVRSQLDWGRVEVFHMDEYVGVEPQARQSFVRFLNDHLVRYVQPLAFHAINGLADPVAEMQRYSLLLTAGALDLTCCGVGVNGHLAFNDPGVADFDDPLTVTRVALSYESRFQQVSEGLFNHLEDVPTDALTLTVPALVSASAVACVVPGKLKRDAVRALLRGPVGPDCPASILRRHERAVLFADLDAYGSGAAP